MEQIEGCILGLGYVLGGITKKRELNVEENKSATLVIELLAKETYIFVACIALKQIFTSRPIRFSEKGNHCSFFVNNISIHNFLIGEG